MTKFLLFQHPHLYPPPSPPTGRRDLRQGEEFSGYWTASVGGFWRMLRSVYPFGLEYGRKEAIHMGNQKTALKELLNLLEKLSHYLLR